jgi:hypothetical protein
LLAQNLRFARAGSPNLLLLRQFDIADGPAESTCRSRGSEIIEYRGQLDHWLSRAQPKSLRLDGREDAAAAGQLHHGSEATTP